MLTLDHISKTFNPGTINEKRALDGLSLHLNPGDFVTVIGVCVPPAQGHVGRGGHSGRAVLAVPVLPEQGHERPLYVLPILRSADV